MKKNELIKKDIIKLEARIAETEKTIKDLSLMTERRNAAQAGDFETLRQLREESNENAEKIAVLSDQVYIDKVTLKYLNDNMKAAAVAEAIPVIKEVLTKYNGKPYGEKTRHAIRATLKEKTGFYIGFNADTITIYDAAYFYNNEARIHTGYNTPVITKENKIDAAPLENAHTWHKYTENPAAAAKKLIKLYSKARAAQDAAKAALSEYNAAAPEALHKSEGYLYNTIL